MSASLEENLFVSIIGILNKIPVFLVGKPGTSKTLTLQILASNLQGQQSSRRFWRQFPALQLFYYQCSEHSTAEAIQRQFDIATRYASTLSLP